MNKTILVFGAYGALGKGAVKVLLNKDYDEFYLFGTHIDIIDKFDRQNLRNIQVSDLSLEKNVIEAFKSFKPSKDKMFYLFSTIGGFAGGKTIWETGEDDFERMLKINLKTNFLLAKYFSLLVKESAGGSICFTSAYTGLYSDAKKGAYGISKSALNHLIKTLAIEGKEINLTANAIAPFIIDTPENRKWMQSADYSKWAKPEEIGELVYSLFSGNNNLTGNIIELK